MAGEAASAEVIWRRYDAMEARLSAGLSERMLDLAGVALGMRVLDLASGRGEPAIAAARRVGPRGRVVGVDLAVHGLTMARERAEREGVAGWLELQVRDAQGLEGMAGGFQAALCRWGLMYMEEPLAALRGAWRLMQPGARLVVAVWAEPERVSYMTQPRQVLARFADVPDVDVKGPGTFRYERVDELRRDVEAAGFRWESVEEMDVPVMEAANGEELVAWTRAFGMGRVLAGLPEDVQRAWESAMGEEAERLKVDGVVRLGGTTRIAVAVR